MNKSIHILSVFVYFFALSEQSESDKCRSFRTPKGICREPLDCPPLLHLFLFLRVGEQSVANVGECSPSGNGNLRICCPIIPVDCTSPLVQKGTCEILEGCPELKRFQTKHSFSEFDHAYGGCSPDSEGTNRWCCPVAEDCTISIASHGQCRLAEDCVALQPVIKLLSPQQILENYGGCGRDTSGGGVRICCPNSSL